MKIKNKFFAAFVTAAALVAAPLVSSPAFAANSDSDNIYSLTNDYRASLSLPTLERDADLDEVAQNWAQHLSDNGYYESGPHNPNVGSQIPSGWSAWAENVAFVTNGDSDEMFVNWQNSPSHDAAMRGDFNTVGVGYVSDGFGTEYGVQVFAYYTPSAPSSVDEPVVLSVDGNSGTAEVSWDAPYNGRSEITSYRVYYKADDDSNYSAVTVSDPSVTSATLSNLLPGTHYTVFVNAVNAIGESTEGASSGLDVPAIAPTSPLNPTLSALTDGLRATWQAPFSDGGAEVVSYNVTLTRVSNGDEVSATVPAGTTSYDFTSGLVGGASYIVRISAVNSAGESAFAGNGTAVVSPNTAPGAPVSVSTIQNGNGEIVVNWTAPAEDGGAAVTNYVVTISGNSESGSRTVPSDVVSQTFSGLKGGVTYAVSVAAVNSVGTGDAFSADVTVDPTAPAQVSGVTAEPTDDKDILVTWNDQTFNGGSEILDYLVRVVRVSDNAVVYSAVHTDLVNLSHQVSNLSYSTAYAVTVTARNAINYGDASDVVSATTSSAPTVPGKITSLQFDNVGPESFHVVWGAPADGRRTITSYVVEVWPTSDPSNVSVFNVTDPETTVTGLENNTNYAFTVKAVNEIGTSDASDVRNFKTLMGAPTEPGNLSTISADGRTVTVTWTAPTRTGGAPLVGYSISVYRGTTYVTAANTTDTSYTFTGSPNVTYTVMVSAYNGTNSSTPATVNVTTDNVPDAPTNVTIDDVSNTVVDVTWTAPVNNGGRAINGYVVEVTDQSGNVVGTQIVSPSAYTAQVNVPYTPGAVLSASVKAVNSVGTSQSAVSVNTLSVPAIVADAPTNPQAALVTSSSIKATWTAPTYDGGAPITGYVLTFYPDGATPVTVNVLGNVTSYTLTGAQGLTNYNFKVSAVNSAGGSMNSVLSNVVQTPPSGTPLAPVRSDATSANSNGMTVVVDGDTVTANFPQAVVGDWVYLYALPSNSGLGWAKVDLNGNAFWTDASIANLPVGENAFVALNPVNEIVGWAGYTVAAPPAPQPQPQPTAPESPSNPVGEPQKRGTEELAETGVNAASTAGFSAGILFLGSVMLLAGAAFQRRRKVVNN